MSPLLDRVRFTDRKEKITRFLGTWGGESPLLAPEGVSTMMGHSWYLVLPSNVKTLIVKKVNYLRKRSYSFMRSFIRSRYRMYMRT